MFATISYVFVAIILFVAIGRQAQSAEPESTPFQKMETCRSIRDDGARLRCFEGALPSANARTAPNSNAGADRWKLVQSRRPDGVGDVAMMHTADTLRSDADFAGISFHCSEKGLELLLIVVRPFPPRTRPHVVLGGTPHATEFVASVLPSGGALLLPPEAMELANGPWQAQADLTVTIEGSDTPIRGAVPLKGLSTALKTLKANCPSG